MGIDLFNPPAYGNANIVTNTKITPADLIMPENNPTGQMNVVLTEEAAMKYGVDSRALDEEMMQKYLAGNGYTDNGGDVGTNLE